jgi:hypothetical protein
MPDGSHRNNGSSMSGGILPLSYSSDVMFFPLKTHDVWKLVLASGVGCRI